MYLVKNQMDFSSASRASLSLQRSEGICCSFPIPSMGTPESIVYLLMHTAVMLAVMVSFGFVWDYFSIKRRQCRPAGSLYSQPRKTGYSRPVKMLSISCLESLLVWADTH